MIFKGENLFVVYPLSSPAWPARIPVLKLAITAHSLTLWHQDCRQASLSPSLCVTV